MIKHFAHNSDIVPTARRHRTTYDLDHRAPTALIAKRLPVLSRGVSQRTASRRYYHFVVGTQVAVLPHPERSSEQSKLCNRPRLQLLQSGTGLIYP